MSMFEQATREKFRFPSIKGDLTTEQLWDLPLTAKNDFSLDGVAKAVNHELKGADEESFVETKSNPRKKELEAMLEILKHIIAVRQAENAAARTSQERRAERARLEAILATKQAAALEGLSEADIQARLDALGKD